MKHNLKLAEPYRPTVAYAGAYYEIALHVRELLECDYALVATADNDSIRIQAIAGAEPEVSGNLAVNLISKLRDWGPVVVDESRLVAVPVGRAGNAMGLLLGYSSKSGRFTGEDLERLMAYGPVAAGILDIAAVEARETTKMSFTPEELLPLSRLITMGELSACFAHEVTNPLMLIRGHLRFVEESLTVDHPLRINFEVIDRASRRIEEMAKRMLDFSRKRAPRTEACDIEEVISDSIRFVQPYMRAQHVDYQFHRETNLPLIDLDRWQISQAFVNLLQNAADAMADCDRRVVSITARIEGNQMRIVIADTGVGIPTVNLPFIFNPFFTSKGERGTGLGLYITKQVIDDHKGTITVQTGNRGTTFVISLPL
ncbi:MAG TPA: ATP-binding protein [Terriglobia bacterium]|nr:ATP-binding protein [Terriglobia bacterium]